MSVATPYSYLLLALMLLLLPLDWLLAAAVAGAVHELGHILCVFFCGGTVRAAKLGIGGCEIFSSTLSYWKQVLCIMAGPLGSLSLLFLSGFFPKLALCGLIHGVYNLLPVYPLDGGRLLHLLLCRLCPCCGDFVLKLFHICTLTGIMLLTLWAYYVRNLGNGVLFCGILLLIKLFPRKTPCKPFEIGVQ